MKTPPVNAHFLEMVRQGARPGCDIAARDCKCFALAVQKHAVTLGDEEARGLVEWLVWCRKDPNAARHYLEET